MFNSKKGFTLVELIGVIAIIAIIGVITVSIVINSLSASKNELEQIQEKNITSTAEIYFSENSKKYYHSTTPSNCEDTNDKNAIFRKCTINSDELVAEGYIEQPKDAHTNENISYIITVYLRIKNGHVKLLDMDINRYEPPLSPDGSKIPVFKDTSGANTPMLADGMIPIVYDSIKKMWVKASTSDGYYAYQDQIWANAVTVTSTNRDKYINADPGTEIPMDDINSMWVWIPRYKYKITSNIGGSSPITNPPQIDVIFENGTNATGVSEKVYRTGITTEGTNTNYYTHPSFRNGKIVYNTAAYDIGGWDEELTGFWVSKFEVGTDNSVCNSNSTQTNCKNVNPIIKPNITSLRSQNMSAKFITSIKFAGGTMNTTSGEVTFSGNSIYGLNSSTDTHVIKSTEWGAAAILSQSQYGKMGNSIYTGINKEIYQNKSSYITGNSNGTPSSSVKNTQCPYDDITDRKGGTGACGAGASTTGTIYGIYDMNGGAFDDVMGNWDNYSGYNSSAYSGFNGKLYIGNPIETGVSFPQEKYYDKYTGTSSYIVTKDTTILGDATWETMGWYSDSASFVLSNFPWIHRGSYNGDTTGAGIFYFNANGGQSFSDTSFHTILMP